CDPAYKGFFYQVYYGAHRFKVYKANPDSFNYKAGRNNTILWHPNTSCGTSTVYIQNVATALLYIYTPYRPNAAALNNLRGIGNSCSSYGNRNFWVFFNDWFGSPVSYYDATRVQGPGSSSATLAIGYTQNVSVQFKNTGTKAWYDYISATGSRRPVVLRATHVNGSASGFNKAFSS